MVMSFNKPLYDECQYKTDLQQSTGTLRYHLDPNRYYNCNKCFMLGGVVGGPAVSHTDRNIVDVESDLLGVTRVQSGCASKKYAPPTTNAKTRGAPGDEIPMSRHLRTAHFIKYDRPTSTGIQTAYPSCEQVLEDIKNSKLESYDPYETPAASYAQYNASQ